MKTLLQSNLDRSALLRELHTLAQDKAFRDLAALWAPTLYKRDAQFFESFLLHQLDGRRHADVIRTLLPRVEADGHDALFQGLYRKIPDEAKWAEEIHALAQSHASDEQVLRAVQRRDMRQTWFSLTEETALALYQRNPNLFGEFVRLHVQRRWRGRETFGILRAEAKRHGDEVLYWFLFREFAEVEEWANELRDLLRRDIPAGQIVDELQKRHPRHLWWHSERATGLAADVLLDVLEKYTSAVLPYLEDNLIWLGRRASGRLLRAVEQMGDESLYWRIFFKVVYDSSQWNQALRELLKRQLSDQDLFLELLRRTPPQQRWQRWSLETDVALAVYRRHSTLLRPFLERFVTQPDLALFDEAQQAGDEEFLDFLTYRFLHKLSSLVYTAYPSKWMSWIKHSDANNARRTIEEITSPLLARFDRLYAESPETYVHHAANILSRIRTFEAWSAKRAHEYNRVFAYLNQQHREVWRRSASMIRELLESPNIHVQIFALDILSDEKEDSAARVVENLPMLRALLLGRTRRNTKKKVLQCLQSAARQGREFARQILPLLDEAIDFRGKRAIDERIIVSYVRLRHGLAAPS